MEEEGRMGGSWKRVEQVEEKVEEEEEVEEEGDCYYQHNS